MMSVGIEIKHVQHLTVCQKRGGRSKREDCCCYKTASLSAMLSFGFGPSSVHNHDGSASSAAAATNAICHC